MEMKVSKAALVILAIALAVLFLVSNIMYGKLNETALIQIVQEQSTETNRLINRVFAMQKELNRVEKELADANNKIIILKTATPVVVTK
jgi:outer membrane murein-binding lipoprotein Lpp